MQKETHSLEYKTIALVELACAMNLVKKVFMRFEAPEYPAEGVQSFLEFIALNSISEKAEAGDLSLWGCFEDNNIVGVCASRNINHVCLMFVDEAYHRRGIGKRLFDFIKRDVIAHGGYDRITVNSSPYALPFYRALGFRDSEPEKIVNGIRHTPMAYPL